MIYTGFDWNVLGFGYHNVPRYFNHWLRTDDVATLRKRMEGAIEKRVCDSLRRLAQY